MYKKLSSLLIIILIICVTSCGGVPQNYLLYQNFPIGLSGILTFNGEKYDILLNVTEIGNGSLTYKSPEFLAGYVFEIRDGDVMISYEDFNIPLSGASPHPSLTAVDLFNLKSEDMVSAEVIDHGGIKLNRVVYERGNDSVTVWVTSDNRKPVRIETNLLVLDIVEFKGSENE